MNAAGMNIVGSQSGNWEMDKANQVVAALITEHPDLKGDSLRERQHGAGRRRGVRRPASPARCWSSASTTLPPCDQLVKEGKVLATADQHADQLAVFGIEYALDMLEEGHARGPRNPRGPRHRRDAGREMSSAVRSPFAWRAIAADYLGLAAALGLLILVFSLSTRHFFSADTFRTIANQIPAANCWWPRA